MTAPDRSTIRELLESGLLTEHEQHELQHLYCVVRASGRLLTAQEREDVERIRKDARRRVQQ